MKDKRSYVGAKYPGYMAETSGIVLTFIKKLLLTEPLSKSGVLHTFSFNLTNKVTAFNPIFTDEETKAQVG